MSTSSAWRSASAIRVVLVAALAAAAFLAAYGVFSGESTGTDSAASESATPSVDGSQAADPSAPPAQAASFTSASAGACVTWDIAEDGTATGFEQTSCDKPHRFEISAREDLSAYPTSEFGRNAERPDITRQNALRDELCEAPTVSYLNGKWDPNGRYDIASILPPAASWEKGDRTLLCGLQTTDSAGIPQESTGKVSEVDQAVVAKPGECRKVDENKVISTVPCTEPHQMETVSVINVAERFPGGYPSDEELDKHLSETCTQDAMDYLGGEENLYQSTLQPFWGALTRESWEGGSRSVNCSLIHVNNGFFSTVTGSAKDGRDGLSIDGAPPTEQPKRNPLRDPNAQPGDTNPSEAPADPAAPVDVPVAAQ
ncbi:septum formation family protein [Corynebacterium singulare]|uniref:Septum formation n=1 Tax=Corynebacterium singulare TaxID=161899 RepID=A0A0B6F7I3_9CORY|nr:septum formation family protein [Corynebacterium singulare]AJI79991.1 Septum formation [Corynebacterium singulare]MCG7276701.1 septum formation family protein [Corynebacterium singulare]